MPTEFPIIRLTPEDPEHDPSMEEWWDLYLKMQEAVTGGKAECVELQAKLDSDQARLIEMRAETDRLETEVIQKHKDRPVLLELVSESIGIMREVERDFESSIARRTQVLRDMSEANSRMEARIAQLYEDLKKTRN